MWILLAQQHPEINPLEPGSHPNVAAALWAWAIFVLLVLLLGKFAWDPIAKGLEARERRISESLKRAEEVERAAREIAETNKAVLARAQQDAQGIVAEARVAARHAAEEMIKKATGEIEAQRERYVREMQMTVDKARADLRRESVDLVIDAAGKLLGRGMTDADSRRLAEQALHDAESVTRN